MHKVRAQELGFFLSPRSGNGRALAWALKSQSVRDHACERRQTGGGVHSDTAAVQGCHGMPWALRLQRHHSGLSRAGAQNHAQEHTPEHRAAVSRHFTSICMCVHVHMCGCWWVGLHHYQEESNENNSSVRHRYNQT